MKILSISDVVEPKLSRRFDARRFKGVDLILSCGDLPPEYLKLVSARLDAPLYFVRGNHDIRHPAAAMAGCLDLNLRIAQFGNLRFLGLEGSRWYNGGPYQYTEAEMYLRVWKLGFTLRFRGGVDVVIAHAPPRRVHDAEDPCHKGFTSFHRLIDKFKPLYFIHGHIHRRFDHEDERITLVNQTKVINTCGHYIFEIPNG